MPASRVRSLLSALFVWPLKAAWAASVVAIPTIGVWLGSSIAAYRNGPVWLVCMCGLLLFPLAPLLWEGLGTWWRARRTRGKRPGLVRPRILTFWDRLILRTLVLNLAVIAGLLVRFPETTFAALSTRGDWFLDGRSGAEVERVRAGLFFAADRLQWLYEAVHTNPNERDVEGDEPPPPPPVPEDRPPPTPTPAPPPVDPNTPTPVDPTPTPTAKPTALWPSPPVLHPLVRGMPASAEASIETVGRFIAEHEPDQRLRIKALHDYVADRIAYDAEAYADKRRTPQDAETVFATRIGVCAGYANLLTALGKAAGEEIVVVVGDARVQGTDLTGEGHAWNAARIDDVWHLIDATWDAGSIDGRTFKKEYDADYLFAPPAVFAVSHFPDEPNWQLLAEPLSRGDFFRKPVLRAAFFAEGLELVAPDRSQVTVADTFEIALKNPLGRFFLVRYTAADGTSGRCEVVNGPNAAARCPLPAAGTYSVDLFVGPAEYGDFNGVATFDVHRS